MRTIKSAAASRANGARSRGPKTEEGKRRSSANSRTHGLLAKIVVLDNESNEIFLEMLRMHYAKLGPVDHVEECAIEEMVAGMWRLRRVWSIEKHLIDRTMATAVSRNPPDKDQGDRTAAAFSTLAAGPELHLLGRYEARIHRMYQRALQTFLLLRGLDVPPPAAPPETETPDMEASDMETPVSPPDDAPPTVAFPEPETPAAFASPEPAAPAGFHPKAANTERTRRSVSPSGSVNSGASAASSAVGRPLPAPCSRDRNGSRYEADCGLIACASRTAFPSHGRKEIVQAIS